MDSHIAIPVKNLEDSRLFYEKLGFAVCNQWEKPARNLKALFMQNGNGTRVELVFHAENENIEFPKICEALHLGIMVENIEEAIEKLEEAGIKTVTPIIDGITVEKLVFIRDPNGFTIELLQG